MKAVAHVPAAEVVAHRIIWSVPIAGVLLVLIGRTADIKVALRSPRTLAMARRDRGLMTVNWGIYVWAIVDDRALETALGYYINPLFSVFLGAVVLAKGWSRPDRRHRAGRRRRGVVLTVETGGLPWVSLTLAVSWGFYALFRKTLPIGPSAGLLPGSADPVCSGAGYVVWLQARGVGHFGGTGADRRVVAARLRHRHGRAADALCQRRQAAALSTIGIMQYIAPTMIFFWRSSSSRSRSASTKPWRSR